ncbi:hypothetical protein JTE90_022612 [Oedothorax gibbosus]|uniref:Uncharacterized protein n=1 Tax=Oedothorax gibbosus TaxID=931172 RepID=A0AAV6TT90_9ARAC|nr:hypothetical protein JTE90_022612 [Oedothorax gibbosus]
MFGIKKLILISAMVLLLASAIMQVYVMYTMSTSQEYVVTTGTNVVTTPGTDAAAYWKDNSWLMIAPSAGSLITMSLVGFLFVMT